MKIKSEIEVPESSPAETHKELLEAAGQVFAEVGFNNATVREICRRAGANIAAINYHFGDKETLYLEVLRYAKDKALAKHPVLLDVSPDAPAEKRLEAFILSFLRRIFDEDETAWHGKLMSREMIDPTHALNHIVEERIRPMAEHLRGIVAEILNLPMEDERVRHCAFSVVSQCVFYHHCGPVVERLFPDQSHDDPANIEKLAAHITEFSLAGMKKFRQSKFCPMKKLKLLLCAIAAVIAVNFSHAADTNSPNWLTRPLSVADALNTALLQNATILKAKNDFEATHGVVIQTRAVALPQVTASGQYKATDPRAVESFGTIDQPVKNWNAGIRIEQNIYAGGRNIAAIRSASTTKKQSLAIYQTAVADTLLNVRIAYYDCLLAAQQIVVREASVKLLEKELQDQKHRLDAGTVPKFNVLRAEVAVANERPFLIQARNNHRIAKNNLANLLGYDLPKEVWEDVPLNLTEGFNTQPMNVILPDAIQQALTRRTELEAQRRTVDLQKLNVVNARSGYQPSISLFAGYDWFNAKFTPPTELDHDINGWNAGVQMTWSIFDGAGTYGRVKQAKAELAKAKVELTDRQRQIELGVRTAYSELMQARETLDSQAKVQESADEALREAKARAEAGTATQLDVLNAETALTQARTTQVQAEHDFATARAKFERAIGNDLAPAK